MTKSILSADSQFLVMHWDAVEELLSAEQRLRRELFAFLKGLRDELAMQEWWTDEWEFRLYQDTQVYVAKRSWRTPPTATDPLIEVGIAGFTPERVFGNGEPPVLFVWSRDQRVAARLVPMIAEADSHPGEIDRTRSLTVVRMPMPKCLPETLAGYFELVTQRFVEFVGYYVALAPKLDEVVASSIA